jgi:hypothetical protein
LLILPVRVRYIIVMKKTPNNTATIGHMKLITQPRTKLNIMSKAIKSMASIGVIIYHFIDYKPIYQVGYGAREKHQKESPFAIPLSKDKPGEPLGLLSSPHPNYTPICKSCGSDRIGVWNIPLTKALGVERRKMLLPLRKRRSSCG